MEDDLVTDSTEEVDMDADKELRDMIEVPVTAIAMHGRQEGVLSPLSFRFLQ